MALASKVRIEIDGEVLKDFQNLKIQQKFFEHNEFEVMCRLDTLESPDSFVVDDSKRLIGLPITISIDPQRADGSGTGLFFKGIVTCIKAKKSGLNYSDQIILSGYSPDIMLDDKPGCRSFESKSLRQIIDEITKYCPKDILKTRVYPINDTQYPYTVQYEESRYAFVKRLAARHGQWLYFDGSELVFGSLSGSNKELVLGIDLTDFDFSVKTNPADFKYFGYDYFNGEKFDKPALPGDGKNQLNDLGRFVFDRSADQYNQQPVSYFSHLNAVGNGKDYELEKVAGLEVGASALGMMAMQGSSKNFQLKLGDKVKIKALKRDKQGDISYGEYIITSLSHTCDHLMNYLNTFQGIPATAKVPPYTNPAAIPRAGTQSAVVTDNKDPDKLGRVKVNFFWQEGLSTPWIRMVNPYAANERGFYFIPEISDEVLVGFEEGDAEKPFVIGSYFHGKNKPSSKWIHEKNKTKIITTESKIQIQFDDEKKVLTLETPAGNKVVINDDAKSILLQDQHNNKVELNSGGITLDSAKDINILAKGEIKIDAKMKAGLHAATEVKVSSMNIEVAADTTVKVKGNATAEISSAGSTTVKGGMVMIN